MQKQVLAFVLYCGCVLLNVAQAANYPQLKNNYVNDYAKVITNTSENTLQSSLASLESRTKVEMTVLTIASVRDYDKTASLETFSTNLFNHWGIGNLPANNGVLLLVAVKDRKVRIELGEGYPSSYDGVAQAIIDNDMIPLFKKGKFSDAIIKGTNAIIDQIADASITGPDTALSSSTSLVSNLVSSETTQKASAFASQSLNKANEALQRISPHLSVTNVGGGLGGGAFLVWAMRLFLRRRPRRCNTCGGSMQRLDEKSDDTFLDAGQLAEEHLSSVDYDVWQCVGCSNKQVYAYKKWFSSYDNCPSCNKRTMKSTSKVTMQATYTSTGSKLITENCQHCSYHHQHTAVIPIKQRSSSSSGGSGGGGRSSGGGASGSW